VSDEFVGPLDEVLPPQLDIGWIDRGDLLWQALILSDCKKVNRITQREHQQSNQGIYAMVCRSHFGYTG
jgi:hypothetical protein